MIRNNKTIKTYIRDNYTELLILLIGGFVIFSLFPAIPYVNTLFLGFLAKISVLWVVIVVIFKLDYVVQLVVFVALLGISCLMYLVGFASYEVVGFALYVVLALAVVTYLSKSFYE